MRDIVCAGGVANIRVPKKQIRRPIRQADSKTATHLAMAVYGVFCAARLDAETPFIATYSTRRHAEAFIDAQEADVRRWLRIEEIKIDKGPDGGVWKGTLQRIAFVEEFVAQVERLGPEPRRPNGFEARRWVWEWLLRPHPALAGRRPEQLLDTEENRQTLREILGRMQSGTYG